MQEQGGNFTNGIPKKSLHVLFKDEAPSLEISKVLNNLIHIAGDSEVFAFNVRKFKAEMEDSMIIVAASSAFIALILFVMTFFQIVVSV